MAICCGSVQAQTPAVGDRYSGEPYVQPTYRQAPATSGPMLSWPGKTAATPPQLAAPSPGSPAHGYESQMRPPPYAFTGQAYRSAEPWANQASLAAAPPYPAPARSTPVAPGQATQARVYGAPPIAPWYQRYAAAAGASAVPSTAARGGAPQSIYDPPASPPPIRGGSATGPSVSAPSVPVSSAANDGETARFYSVHRQYGLTPDPDPIPPQFFTRTADLSDPVGPSPVYKAATTSGGATTAVRAVQSEESTSTLGQP